MRHYPAALALCLVLGVSASMGEARVGEPLDPQAQALITAGQGLLVKGDVDAATDQFESALAIAPGAVPALLALGDAARAGQMQGKAIHYYRLALAREPDNLAALAGEGGAMAEKGAVDRARRNLARLEGLCGRTCGEVTALNAAIAKGPVARVVTAEAVKPAPVVETN